MPYMVQVMREYTTKVRQYSVYCMIKITRVQLCVAFKNLVGFFFHDFYIVIKNSLQVDKLEQAESLRSEEEQKMEDKPLVLSKFSYWNMLEIKRGCRNRTFVIRFIRVCSIFCIRILQVIIHFYFQVSLSWWSQQDLVWVCRRRVGMPHSKCLECTPSQGIRCHHRDLCQVTECKLNWTFSSIYLCNG